MLAIGKNVKETCIQEACFFLPFFESGEWRTKDKSPWQKFVKQDVDAQTVRDLAEYTNNRMTRSAAIIDFLTELHDDWEISPRKDGVFMETATMSAEDVLPKLEAAGFNGSDFVLYTEYTRKWGML